MSVINFSTIQPVVYVILGIDENEHDQVLGVRNTYEEAKQFCIHYLSKTKFYDLWIEKHPLQ